ncbi:S24/S26 family peptidase [Nonomuraea endophytica]|uniref:Peptidase S24/S26A/S26B/S26C domain-containing protein n=1 Tax=Nonomuraea endophytica TaxID=714136 RepID=A0A7W8ABC7_9ACTN|nr:S24/S26 family peptidase [Nonomuraea endophytica]MBB5082026.1 hypothetical protein [Nonomuraea endophytica]
MGEPPPAPGLIDLIIRGLEQVGTVTVPVTGVSMLPTLRHDDRVVLEAVAVETIKPQDVVAFRADGRLVLHRVHAVRAGHLITAGDSQRLYDPPVPLADVVAVAPRVPPRDKPSRWPSQGGEGPVDVWLVEPTNGTEEEIVPPWWRLRRRTREGVCVSGEVLAEIRAAAERAPTVGVSEKAVFAARDVLGAATLPAGTQVLVGCSFGHLHEPMRGHLVPSELADVLVRVGEPEERLDAAETLRRLTRLVASAS